MTQVMSEADNYEEVKEEKKSNEGVHSSLE